LPRYDIHGNLPALEYFLLSGTPGQPVELTLQNAGGRRITRTVHRKSGKVLAALWPKPPGFEFRVLPGNIGYVALNSFEDNSVADQFVAAFDKIAQTSALILDVRNNGGGNSGVGMRILATLIDKPVSLEFWQTRDYKPIFRAWGRPIAMLSVPFGDVSPDPAHHYSKPIILLSSPRTFSAAEDFLVAFDESRRGLPGRDEIEIRRLGRGNCHSSESLVDRMTRSGFILSELMILFLQKLS
jgi:carboxyl-terminal processing protease